MKECQKFYTGIIKGRVITIGLYNEAWCKKNTNVRQTINSKMAIKN
jgi:hypothetical protein